jgi:hypothetical protein
MLGDFRRSNRREVILPKRAENLLNDFQEKIVFEDDKKYDLVYILKESDDNPDLIMSLRSIEKYCTFRKIWVVGYKPSWLQNVEYIPTSQDGNKWDNSCTNWLAACKNKNISEDFILMNDDFFALQPIYNWKTNLNIALGQFDAEAKKYKNTKFSKWQGGFVYGAELLDELGCKSRLNYEAHTPIMINKKKYLEMMKIPAIKEYMKTKKVLHKRSIYKNLYPDSEVGSPRIIRDVKMRLHCDLLSLWLMDSWLSVFDDVVTNNKRFPKVNYFLNKMFPNKSMFEK